MDLMHPAIPPLAILLGAGTLTLARYRVAPLTWRISSHLARYALVEFACLLAIGYVAILPAGPAVGIVLLGLGAGFLAVGLMLLFRRNERLVVHDKR
jgi:hypothetical protein